MADSLDLLLSERCGAPGLKRRDHPTIIQGEIIYAPPPSPHFWPKGHFPVEGGGGVYFEAPRGKNFIRPPLFIHPPPLGECFQGWGGGGV